MSNRQIAYLLIGLGAITLLARLSDGAAWLWIGLVAAAMLAAYARERTYGFLVLGAMLAGTAVGILIQGMFGLDGLFLVSLGAGIAAIDVIERRANRWPRTVGAVLAVIGFVVMLEQTGAFGSVWFALLLIAIGIAIIVRGSEAPAAGPPGGTAPGGATGPPAGPAGARADGGSAAPGTGDGQSATRSGGGEHAGGGGPAAARRVRLEAWRARTAASEGKSPRSILTDEVLDALAERAPADLVELATVRGIGPVKLERFGAEVIEVLRRQRA